MYSYICVYVYIMHIIGNILVPCQGHCPGSPVAVMFAVSRLKAVNRRHFQGLRQSNDKWDNSGMIPDTQ